MQSRKLILKKWNKFLGTKDKNAYIGEFWGCNIKKIAKGFEPKFKRICAIKHSFAGSVSISKYLT
jgi:hypothetical protein